MKKRYFVIIFLAVFLFFLFNFSLAGQLEALPPSVTNIPTLINYFFNLGMIIAASLAVLVLAYGAFLYLVSEGKPEPKKDAKDRMFKAIVGLVILLASWLIMGVVNPQLQVLKIEPLSGVGIELPLQPGVYIYKDNDCSGEEFSFYTTSSVAELEQFGCIKILNDPENNVYYGAILHDSPNFQSICSPLVVPWFFSFDKEKIWHSPTAGKFGNSSMTVFRTGKNLWQTAGDGVVFYSHPFTDHKGGGRRLIKPTSGGFYTTEADSLVFDYTGTKIPSNERSLKTSFAKSPGSIKLLGEYLVILSASNWCQPFNRDNQNLKTEWITADLPFPLSKVTIFPVK